MDTTRLQKQAENQWRIAPYGKMRVPAIIYASEALIRDMDDKVYEQVTNVATLPGIVKSFLRHARCPLGIWLSHRRRRRFRCGKRRRDFRRRRGLRYFLRRAHTAHRTDARSDSSR